MASQTQTKKIDQHLGYVELLSNNYISRKIGERASIKTNETKTISLISN